VYLESVNTPGYFISFNEEGQPGDEALLKTKEKSAQFEIQIVSLAYNKKNIFMVIFKIAYGPGIQPEKDDPNIEKSEELPPPSYWAATATPNPKPTSS
jgi:hypothetical protein